MRHLVVGFLIVLGGCAIGPRENPAERVTPLAAAAQQQQVDQQIPYLDLVLARILQRVAAPLITDPELEVLTSQHRYLDPTDPDEREFLNMANSADDTVAFSVRARKIDGRGVRFGAILDLRRATLETHFASYDMRGMTIGQDYSIPSGKDVRLAQTLGQRQRASKWARSQVTGVRRDPQTGSPVGYFYDTTHPMTRDALIYDPASAGRYRRATEALDHIYGIKADGSPLLTWTEFSLHSLANELFLYQRTSSGLVLWAPDFGSPMELTTARRAVRSTLRHPRRVSLLREVLVPRGAEGPRRVLYNPLDLRYDEVGDILRAVPQADVEVVVVDPKVGEESRLRTAVVDGVSVLLVNHDVWRRIVAGEGLDLQGLSLQPVDAGAVRSTIHEVTTVELQPGTVIVTESAGATQGERVGIPLAPPRRIPQAKFMGSDVQWLELDPKVVNRAFAGSAATVGDEPFVARYSDNGKVYHVRTVRALPERGPPVVMASQDGGFIEIRVGLNWVNPGVEVDRRKSLGVSIDPVSGEVEYHQDSVPPVRTVTVKRPAFVQRALIEVSAR